MSELTVRLKEYEKIQQGQGGGMINPGYKSYGFTFPSKVLSAYFYLTYVNVKQHISLQSLFMRSAKFIIPALKTKEPPCHL